MAEAGTIILPIAGRSSRFKGTRPKWMLTAPDGRLMLEMALTPIPDWRQRRVVIGALKEHLHDLGGEGAIRRALGDAPEIVQFEQVTKGPAMTVAEIIKTAKISGPIFVKDCDSWFTVEPIVFGNIICIVDLRLEPKMRNIPGKSFVQLNENLIVTGIYEKLVCSNQVSVGGYGFESTETFLDGYESIVRSRLEGEIFVSHVILEGIRRGEVFRGASVVNYKDVGTIEAWHEFRENSAVYIVDLDGVILYNAGAYLPPLWSDSDKPLIENVEAIRNLISAGAQIVFMTARPELYREKTESTLRALGLKWHSIIFGMNHARRYLINDYASSNPYPAAVAVNVRRDNSDLVEMLRGLKSTMIV